MDSFELVDRRRLCRPWLRLYQYNLPNNLPGKASCDSVTLGGEENAEPDVKFNFWLLPPDVLQKMLSLLDAEQLSILAMTSKLWRVYVYNPRLWRNLAEKIWPGESRKDLERKVVFNFKTWRHLVIYRPHIRVSGVYIMRCQFLKTSAGQVFPVTFHRILRFYTDGTVVALTTPEALDKAIQRVRKNWKPLPGLNPALHKAAPLLGQYEFDERQNIVEIKLPLVSKQYPNMRQGTAFYRLALHSSRPGAFDTLNLVSHSAITDHDNNSEIVIFNHHFGSDRFKFISKYGFKTKVLRIFPEVRHSKYTTMSRAFGNDAQCKK